MSGDPGEYVDFAGFVKKPLQQIRPKWLLIDEIRPI